MNQQDLYSQAKQDFQVVSEPLFDFAEQQVRRRGAFVPFGAVLDGSAKVSLHAASSGADRASCLELLPLLHEGLRSRDREGVRAVAVCEWVKITPEGSSQTDAIKVLVEHANGLTVAFYLPMRRKMLGKWHVGEMLVLPAEPEIGLWSVPNQPAH